MSAYTQTRFHHQNWNRRIGAFVHPKHIDNEIDALLHDLHALGRYGNNHAIDTRIEAYLVSDPQPPNLASDAHVTNNNNATSDNNNNEQNSNNGTATTAQGTDTVQEPQLKKEDTQPLGSDPTKEDMDLIEVLWRQDMDLGVGREMYDTNLRKELEKERELELHKKQQQETFEKEKQQQQPQTQEQQTNITYIVDGETGELIAAPADNEVPQPVEVPVQAPVQLPPAQLPEPQLQQQQQAELDIQEALQLITQEVQQQQQQQQMPIGRQNSFEQRWDDVANLLNIPQVQNITDDMEMPAAVNAQDALLQNATLPTPQPNGTDFNINTQPINVAPNDTNFVPFNLTAPSYPNAMNTTLDFDLFSVNQSAGNVSASQQGGAVAFPFNASTDSFLQELLDNGDDDLERLDFSAMDLNNTEAAVQQQQQQQEDEKMDDSSSDSAVGSMAGSNSPDDMYDRLSSISSSHYHGAEGATGGHDSVFSPTVDLKKEVQDPSFSYEDFGFNEDPVSSANETEFKYPSAEADPRHVAHNHSYPLAPGQQPRERKLTAEERRATAQMTRDEKKCRTMKVPFSIDDIIHSPVDEFNDMLTKYKLSETQLQLIRDVRRRGKNKVAAQNCRKRKMEVIQSLEDEVNGIRQERDRLLREKARLNKSHGDMKEKYSQMYQEVFRSLRDENGRPYDPNQFTLQQTSDGNVFLVPVNTTAPQRDHDEKPLHKRKNKKSSR